MQQKAGSVISVSVYILCALYYAFSGVFCLLHTSSLPYWLRELFVSELSLGLRVWCIVPIAFSVLFLYIFGRKTVSPKNFFLLSTFLAVPILNLLSISGTILFILHLIFGILFTAIAIWHIKAVCKA